MLEAPLSRSLCISHEQSPQATHRRTADKAMSELRQRDGGTVTEREEGARKPWTTVENASTVISRDRPRAPGGLYVRSPVCAGLSEHAGRRHARCRSSRRERERAVADAEGAAWCTRWWERQEGIRGERTTCFVAAQSQDGGGSSGSEGQIVNLAGWRQLGREGC